VRGVGSFFFLQETRRPEVARKNVSATPGLFREFGSAFHCKLCNPRGEAEVLGLDYLDASKPNAE
jgi:hypothetical protein